MKKLKPDLKATIRAGMPAETWRNLNKQYLHNIEHYKGKRRGGLWTGLIWGFVLGYIPYIVHMNQLLK